MKLWLDDVRLPPDNTWTWVKSVDEAIAALTHIEVTEMSLDHDLGLIKSEMAFDPLAPTGYDFCLWMAENDIWPTKSIKVHSANSVGAERMCGVVNRYSPLDLCRWVPQWN